MNEAVQQLQLKQLLCKHEEILELAELAATTTTLNKNEKNKLKLLQWFHQQFNDAACTLEEFAMYFLHGVRQQTEIHLRTMNENDATPKSQTPVRTFKSATTTADIQLNATPRRVALATHQTSKVQTTVAEQEDDSLILQTSQATNRSSQLCNSSERSFANALQSNASTPIRRANTPQQQPQQRRSGNSGNGKQQQHHSAHFSTTPNSQEKQTSRNNSASSSLCLGDFLVLNTTTRSNKKHKTPQTQHANSSSSTNTSTNTSITNADTPNAKPKKRVVPTTISTRASNAHDNGNSVAAATSSTPFGNSASAFSNDNNLLKISRTEIDDKNKCSIMQARKSLKLNAIEISKELEVCSTNASNSNELSNIRKSKLVSADELIAGVGETVEATLPSVDLDKVTKRTTVQCLATIYSILIDLNFTTNILNEISFLLNLLNATEPSIMAITEKLQHLDTADATTDLTQSNAEAVEPSLNLLNNIVNCIYFALCVLQQQRSILALLDFKSLGVVLHNERLCSLDAELQNYLSTVYQCKHQLDLQQKSIQDASIRFDKSCKNVYYQAEKDSRKNFASSNDFGAFKTQRDLFYLILKQWESNHLNPNWCFYTEMHTKIQEIFHHSEHPINMSHFAQLFVAQLLISSSDNGTPEDIGLDMDLQKFSKLNQRLVAPSNFSVDYQFPRNQAFFRDFIREARSLAFAEQLKMALYHKLITLNDSTFDQINLRHMTPDAEEDDTLLQRDEQAEFVVRPEIMSSMLVLAKFLGFVTTLPFKEPTNGNIALPADVEKAQLMLRSLFQPNFNLHKLLQHAKKHGKLLITLPWLVQYLALLDNVTLQLETCTQAFEVMFELYAKLGMAQEGCAEFHDYQLTSTAVFIVRCCLGWLLETKTIIAEQYYNYRTRVAIAKTNPELNEHSIVKTNTNIIVAATTTTTTVPHDVQLNAMLESILNVACPFLAEFRVSIMPTKYALIKYASRTGRYRHITTRLAEPLTASPSRSTPSLSEDNALANDNATASNNNDNNLEKQQQTKLIEAFLHSQNSSMRRLLEFVIERIYKSIIKDAQYHILLPSKAAADSKVNEITSSNAKKVAESVLAIYKQARDDAMIEWDAHINKCLDERIESALQALLATDTSTIIKNTYSLLIRRNTMQKISSWRHANIFKNNFYCSNLNNMTDKICKANRRERQVTPSSELEITKASPSVADLLDELQYWLHCSSMRVDLMSSDEPIIAFLQQLPLAFENTLPTICYRLIGVSLVQLLQHIIARHPQLLTAALMNACCQIWLTTQMQDANKLLQKSKVQQCNNNNACDNESLSNDNDINANAANDVTEIPNVFEALITIAFIQTLDKRHDCYEKLTRLLIEMIRQHIVTAHFINKLFMPIFKENWHVDTLNEISKMLQIVAEQTVNISSARNGGGGVTNANTSDNSDNSENSGELKSHLFMETLADFCRNVDDF